MCLVFFFLLALCQVFAQPTFCGCYCDSLQSQLCTGTYDISQTQADCQSRCGTRSSFLSAGSVWTFPINSTYYNVQANCNASVSCCPYPTSTFSTGVQGSSFIILATGKCGGSGGNTVVTITLDSTLSTSAGEPVGVSALGVGAANNITVNFPSVEYAVFNIGGLLQTNADRLEPPCCIISPYVVSSFYNGKNFTGTLMGRAIEKKLCTSSVESNSEDTLYGSVRYQCALSVSSVDVSSFPNREVWYDLRDTSCTGEVTEAFYWLSNFCLSFVEGRLVKSVARRCSGGALNEEVYVSGNCQGNLLRSTSLPTGQCIGQVPDGYYTLVCSSACLTSAFFSMILFFVLSALF